MRQSKLSLIVLTILFSSISLFAQTDSVKCNSQIQFHLINGYSLSYLNMLSPTAGIRFKVDIGLNGSSKNIDQVKNYYSNGLNNSSSEEQIWKTDESSSSQFFNLAVNYSWLSNITEEIRLYIGIGPLVNFSRSNSENNQTTDATQYYPASKFSLERISSSLGLGIQGVIGIECSVMKRISIMAEFNLNSTYNWDYWKESNGVQSGGRTETTEDGNSWNYGLNNLKIGISFNF